MTELWKPVVGFEDYQVSDLGNVRSHKNGNERLLKQQLHDFGHLRVTLSDGQGTVRRLYVHCLVADAFIGPKPEGNVVRHKNDVKSDNRAANLHYGTKSQNGLDRGVSQAAVRINRENQIREILAVNPNAAVRHISETIDTPLGTASTLVAKIRSESV